MVVIKAKVHAGGENRRAVVSDRPAAWCFPKAIYDTYTEWDASENRNFELKCDLRAERLSDHQFKANFSRLYLCTLALNFPLRLRNEVRIGPTPEFLGLAIDLPVEALPEAAKRTYSIGVVWRAFWVRGGRRRGGKWRRRQRRPAAGSW